MRTNRQLQCVLQPSRCPLPLQHGAAGLQEQCLVHQWLPDALAQQDGPPEASVRAVQRRQVEEACLKQRRSSPLLPAQPLRLHQLRVQLLSRQTRLEWFGTPTAHWLRGPQAQLRSQLTTTAGSHRSS